MKMLRQLLDGLIEDARGASLYARSRREAFSLSRRKKRDGRALLAAYREIGDRSSKSEAASSRRSFQAARENEARLAECEAELQALGEKEAAAREGLGERTRAREEELDRLAGEVAALSRLHAGKKRDLSRIEKELERLEKGLDRSGEDETREERKARLRELRKERPGLEDAEQGARVELEKKREELRRERSAWKEEETRLEDTLREAVREVHRAEVRREEARAAVEGSREALGRSMVLAGLFGAEMEGPAARAKELLAGIRAAEEGIRERRVAAATVRAGAVRFAAVWGGALLLLALAPALALSGRGTREGGPRVRAAGARDSRGPAADPARPSPGTASPPGAESTLDVPLKRFRAALLALPALASVTPTGKIEILARAPAAGGAERIDLRVFAGQAGEEVRVVLRVVVDESGRILGVVERGTLTSEDDELMKLLQEMGG